MSIVAVYVNDIVIAGQFDMQIKVVRDAISSQYSVKDLGPLKYFLGVKIIQDTDRIWIGQ